MRATSINVRAVTVPALEAGSGRALLYLHGIDGPRVNPMLEALAQSHRVTAPEFPGFGTSRLPEWLDGIEDAALFGLDLAEALGAEPLHLAGHSIGGWIAAEMALRNPRRFASLSLISPLGAQPVAPAATDIFALPPEAALRAQFFDPALAELEIAARAGEEIDITLQNRAGLARLGWTPRLASLRLPRWLRRISAPTLILWGADDTIAPAECADVFMREIPRAEIIRYARCGHALPNEKGAEAAAAIAAFIAGARA